MKTIGLLGGTSWPSTIDYYRLLNQLVAKRLGGHHSASLVLRSIDYHAIKSAYGKNWETIPGLLKAEIENLLSLRVDCIILCNNTLHKAFDAIGPQLDLRIPFFHAVGLTAQHAAQHRCKRVLLLATKFTMEDGFFSQRLEALGIEVTIPELADRQRIQDIQSQLAEGVIKPEFPDYFRQLLARYETLDGVVLACTELPMAIDAAITALPILDPVVLQCQAAVNFALG